MNAISVVEFVIGHVEPTQVTLGFTPEIKVETSAIVKFVGTKFPKLEGELVQDWMFPGDESREITIKFTSGISSISN